MHERWIARLDKADLERHYLPAAWQALEAFPVNPVTVADGLTAMTNGLWLDLLLTPRDLTRERGRDITLAYLAHFFPEHIDMPATVGAMQ